MRRILVDHARRRNLRRGGGVVHVTLHEALVVVGEPASDPDVAALDSALDELTRLDQRKAQVVETRSSAA